MLAPSAASLLRYGACPLPITLERCLFSKMTTTMWSGCGTVGLCSLGEGCRTVGFCFSGENGCSIRLNLGGGGCARALVSFGCVGTAVGSLPEYTGGPVDGGSATPQAAHVSIKTAQPANRGKACTWNPLLIQVLANHHSTHGRPQTQHREDASREHAGSLFIHLDSGAAETAAIPTNLKASSIDDESP